MSLKINPSSPSVEATDSFVGLSASALGTHLSWGWPGELNQGDNFHIRKNEPVHLMAALSEWMGSAQVMCNQALSQRRVGISENRCTRAYIGVGHRYP